MITQDLSLYVWLCDMIGGKADGMEMRITKESGNALALIGAFPSTPWESCIPVFLGKSQLITIHPNSILIVSHFHFKRPYLGQEFTESPHLLNNLTKTIKKQTYIRCFTP